MTLAERLMRVRGAITTLEGGAESGSMDGEVFVGADLQGLYERQEKIELKIDRAEGLERVISIV